MAERTLALSQEIEWRKKFEEQLQKLASSDALSKACNRREFDRLLSIEFERAHRYASPLSIIMFDIDCFKKINDSYGHLAGDTVIVELTEIAAREKRQSDILARWGGDEFTLLIPGVSKEGACILAEKVRAQIERHNFTRVGKITCSFGVAGNASASGVEDLMLQVDAMLYKAKASGRNCVCSE